MASRHSAPLPMGWPNHIKSGLLHAISLAAIALTIARSRGIGCRLQAELDRANSEIALLKEELEIKDGRSSKLLGRSGRSLHAQGQSRNWALRLTPRSGTKRFSKSHYGF